MSALLLALLQIFWKINFKFLRVLFLTLILITKPLLIAVTLIAII